jgi:hypothetical protein
MLTLQAFTPSLYARGASGTKHVKQLMSNIFDVKILMSKTFGFKILISKFLISKLLSAQKKQNCFLGKWCLTRFQYIYV